MLICIMYKIVYAYISLTKLILQKIYKNVMNFHYFEIRLLYNIQLYNNTD